MPILNAADAAVYPMPCDCTDAPCGRCGDSGWFFPILAAVRTAPDPFTRWGRTAYDPDDRTIRPHDNWSPLVMPAPDDDDAPADDAPWRDFEPPSADDRAEWAARNADD